MTVRMDEVHSEVDVQPEPTGAPAAPAAMDADREARLFRERRARFERDRARTFAEGYHD